MSLTTKLIFSNAEKIELMYNENVKLRFYK